MKSKPKRGKWIVKLEKLTKCFKCSSYFITSKDYNEHFKTHLDETEIKVEEEQDVRDELQNSVSSSGETKKKIESQSNHFQSQRGKMKDVEYKEINNENGVKKFQCIRCEKVFKTLQSVVQHIYLIHREKKLKCEKCCKLFAFKSMLQKHLKKCYGIFRGRTASDTSKTERITGSHEKHYNMTENEEGEKLFRCTHCPKTFSKRSIFQMHYYRFHKEKTFTCNKCDKKFSIPSLLKMHQKKCSTENGKSRTKKIKRSLQKHYQIIESEEGVKFQCNQCQKMFEKIPTFTMHFYNYHKEKNLKCDKCDEKFSIPSLLKMHQMKCDGNKQTMINALEIVIDDEKKIFQCNKCEEKFESMVLFMHHFYKTHSDEKLKAYQCNICDKFCQDNWKLKKHLKICDGILRYNIERKNFKIIQTEDGQKFQCLKCPETFSQKLELGTQTQQETQEIQM